MVMEVSSKRVRTKGEREKVVFTGVIADYSAKLPFVSWSERVEKNKIVQIENAYVKRWKGQLTLYIGKNTQLYEREIDFPDYAELRKPKRRTIAEILDCKGAFDVVIEGDIVSSSTKGNRMVLDDGTGTVLLDSGDLETGISFGTPVNVIGNVIEQSEHEYVLIAEKVIVKDEELVITDLKNFLARYT